MPSPGASVRAPGSRAAVSYMIESTADTGMTRVTFANGEVTAVADTLKEKGGADGAFRPHELLEAALATCITISLQTYARQHDLPLQRATARVRLDRSQQGEAALHCDVQLDGPLSAEQREKLLAVARNCPVRQTLGRRLTFHG
jgi:putative redox protein